MMSEYKMRLAEILDEVKGRAKENIPELYHILTDKENYSPIEAKKKLEKDLGGRYAKDTILEFLPEECKDEIKVKAGQEGAAKKKEMAEAKKKEMEMLADGSISAGKTQAGPNPVGQTESKSGGSRSGEQEQYKDARDAVEDEIYNLRNELDRANETIQKLKIDKIPPVVKPIAGKISIVRDDDKVVLGRLKLGADKFFDGKYNGLALYHKDGKLIDVKKIDL